MNKRLARLLKRTSWVIAVVLHLLFCQWGSNESCKGTPILTKLNQDKIASELARRERLGINPQGVEGSHFEGLFTAEFVKETPSLAVLMGIVVPVLGVVTVRFIARREKTEDKKSKR